MLNLSRPSFATPIVYNCSRGAGGIRTRTATLFNSFPCNSSHYGKVLDVLLIWARATGLDCDLSLSRAKHGYTSSIEAVEAHGSAAMTLRYPRSIRPSSSFVRRRRERRSDCDEPPFRLAASCESPILLGKSRHSTNRTRWLLLFDSKSHSRASLIALTHPGAVKT